MAMKIGCDNLVYATVTETAAGAVTFGTITKLPGVMKIDINPNASQETAFYDDGPGDTATTLGSIDVAIEKSSLTTDEKGALLGHKTDANGALVYGGNDTPPWLAIGFRTLKSNGKYRYVWLYKGKFMEPEDNSETKGDSVNLQNESISGKFVRLEKEYTVNGEKVKPWKIEADADDEASSALVAKWFDKVVEPGMTLV